MQSPSGQGPVWPGASGISLQQFEANLTSAVEEYIDRHQLGHSFRNRINTLYLPMAEWIAGRHSANRTLFIGINGAQGSGKSTLAGLLELILTEVFNKHAVSVSIDDFYHGLDTRKQMAANSHPLFITRGVPGTHDVELAINIFQQIKDRSAPSVLIPQFDKAIDDRLPRSQWKSYDLPIDILLFEGWCVGARPQPEAALVTAVNTLEQEEDPDGTWRRAVNRHLEDEYQEWFDFIDTLIMLAVPSMEQVYEWRGLQEHKLQSQTSHSSAPGIMDKSRLHRFIMHYERLTRHQLADMPQFADAYLPLDKQHQVAGISIRQRS